MSKTAVGGDTSCKILLFCTALFLSGCATTKGIEATEDELKACATETCTVWTERELQELVRRALRKGYEAGKDDKKKKNSN